MLDVDPLNLAVEEGKGGGTLLYRARRAARPPARLPPTSYTGRPPGAAGVLGRSDEGLGVVAFRDLPL